MKNCEKCGTEKQMHYIAFCPKCDASVLEPKVLKYYDLFKIMYHMEANGHMSKQRFWRNHIINNYNISNDSTFSLSLDYYSYSKNLDEDKLEIHEYLQELKRVLKLDENESEITVEVSW